MRLKSFAAEKRQKQDQQANVALGVLFVVSIFAWLWDTINSYCVGALQGAIAPLFIITLRYGYRVVSRKRIDRNALFHALAFLLIFLALIIRLFPSNLWQWGIIMLCFVSTVLGIQKFRFTPVFMLVNCMLAGAILL